MKWCDVRTGDEALAFLMGSMQWVETAKGGVIEGTDRDGVSWVQVMGCRVYFCTCGVWASTTKGAKDQWAYVVQSDDESDNNVLELNASAPTFTGLMTAIADMYEHTFSGGERSQISAH